MENETVKNVTAQATTKVDETTKVAMTMLQDASDLLIGYAFSVVGAILILIVGFTLASLLSRWVRGSLQKLRHVDLTLASFLSNIIKYAIWVLVIVMVLGQFGVQTTSIIAVLGAAGLAIGLALQGTLANIASGIMLLMLRPFRVGEYIEAGSINGTVQEIGLFTTELKKVDGLFVMAPNSQLWNSAIINYSRHPTRRFELVVGISYGDSMEEAQKALMDLATSDERVLDQPAPQTFVGALADSSVNVGLRVWTETPNYLGLSWDLTQAAKAKFDEMGITIPFPQREITQRIVEEK